MKTNFNLINEIQTKKIPFLIALLFCFRKRVAYTTIYSTENEKLLSRMDLDSKELESIKVYQNKPIKAAKEHLIHFTNRKTIKHPIQINADKDIITEKDLKMSRRYVRVYFCFPASLLTTVLQWRYRHELF